MAMSETTAWTPAASANDPRVAELFRELFMVVFPDSHALKPQVGDGRSLAIARSRREYGASQRGL